jgi:UDP-galactopyranose mutase
VQSLIEEHGIKRPVVWTRVATHIAWNAIQKINPELLVYQVVDNFPHNPIIPASLRDRHAKHAELFSEAADVIFASARGLKKKKESYGDQVFFFPNGVEVDKFRRPVQAEPEILKDISRPLLGFVGTVAPPVDFATIKKVARRKREWSFVFIGPVTQFARLGDLRKLNNVHFIGPVDHDELPAYLQALDLGLIPYELTEFTEYTFPSKLAEYLSSGIPVLASNLPEMRHYRDVIGIYRNADEFILEAVGQMRQQGERKRQRRLKIADSLSWDHIVNQMMGVVEEQMSSASTQQHSV